MEITPTDLPDVLLIEPNVHRDERGFFLETWHAARYAEAGLDVGFVQDNHSRSQRGTLRGLHAQIATPQGKLVRASLGEIFDVAVDIRHGSPTFGKHVSAVLSAKNWAQLWIPAGFAHGFCTLEPDTEVLYKTTGYYSAESSRGTRWDDPALGIPWPTEAREATLSSADQTYPPLAELPIAFRYGVT